MSLDGGMWTEFSGDLASRSDRLARELAGAWKDLRAIAAPQREAFAALLSSGPPGDGLQPLQEFFGAAAPALLTEPLAVYGQKRPLQRSLSAMEEHESALGDLLRRLPKTAGLSGRDLMEMAGPGHWGAAGLWRALHRKPKEVQLRDAVADHLMRMILERAALDGAFQLLLAEASLHLLAPWQSGRRALLAALARSDGERVDLAAAHAWWIETADEHERRAALLLARYEAWAGRVQTGIAQALLRAPHPVPSARRSKWTAEHQRHVSFWSRQQRAVRSVIDLELHLVNLAQATVQDTLSVLDALEAEHRELVEEIDAAIGWLEQWQGGEASDSFPQPKARLLSAEERLAEWTRRVSAQAREELPVTIEAVEPHRELPGWRRPWRDLEPVRVFLAGLAAGAPALLSGLREAESVHRAMVREIERAREVVDFGFETAHAEGGAGQDFAREAVGNALALLTYQKEATPEIRPAAEASAARAEAMVLLETDIALERSRVGLLAHATRRRGGEALRQLRGLAAEGARAGSQRLWAAARSAYRWALLKIGWTAAPARPAEPVIRRADLARTLEVPLHARELPMLYRRLFRLAPVEDRRFLVGRDAEMAGFADALKCWEAGKGASVIVIGARGSGKTSLLNCAISGVLGSCEVISGQFCERLITPAQLSGFMRGLFRIPADGDLAAALGEGRRVVVIEEFERTYLRTAHGFDALRMLLDLMYSTGRSTLWVFSVNEAAYRYLDAVVGLGRHFSHRINAMSVKQEDLASAILQRHGLSGLRLEFAPLPAEDPRVSHIRRLLGFEQDPKKVFLDALYEQSEGIFRAAFELWQGSIERVEGGVVHMRQPLTPDYQKLSAEMTLEDCFLLKAILQHGSLTAEEVARVLAAPPQDSLRQLERLHLLDVLEPEPASPGVRVRPEAGRLVRETLSRRNLL